MIFKKMDINTDDLVSIIVPIYNTPKLTLQRTISTLAGQTYKKIEIIFIDDGSLKETYDLIDFYALKLKKKNINAKVFHVENKGVSKARNLGIKKAVGDWICFVDSDDLVSSHYIEYLLKAAKECDAPISCCGFKKIYSPSEVNDIEIEVKSFLYTKEDVWRHINTGYCVNKLYKRETIEDIYFDENKSLAEDFLFVNQVFERTPIVAQIDTILYWYLLNPYSSTSFLHARQCYQAIEAYEYGLDISYVKNDEQLHKGRLRGLITWYFRYVEALADEKPEGYKNECLRIKQLILEISKSIDIKIFGIYEKIIYFGFIRLPAWSGFFVLKFMRLVRRIRLRIRRLKK